MDTCGRPATTGLIPSLWTDSVAVLLIMLWHFDTSIIFYLHCIGDCEAVAANLLHHVAYAYPSIYF